MLINKNVFFFLILFSVFNYGQSRKSEIGIITDNDLYTSSKNDMYYTNGLAITLPFGLHTAPKTASEFFKANTSQVVWPCKK